MSRPMADSPVTTILGILFIVWLVGIMIYALLGHARITL